MTDNIKTTREIIEAQINALEEDVQAVTATANLLSETIEELLDDADLSKELESDIAPLMTALGDFAGSHNRCFPACDCNKGCKVATAFENFIDSGYSHLLSK